MLNIQELEDIVDNFSKALTIANRLGEEELKAFLAKHNIVIASDEEDDYCYCELRTAHILIVGGINIKKKVIDAICKSLSIDPDRLDYVSYEEATNYKFANLKYSNKYSDVIVGPTPHMGKGIEGYNSIIGFIESNSKSCPKLTKAVDSNSLNINKTSLKKALTETRLYKEYIISNDNYLD